MAETKQEEESRIKATEGLDYVSKILAAINPGKFYDYQTAEDLNEFKKLVKNDFWKAVDKAKVKVPEEHQITYNSAQETLEPVYFWILDLMNQLCGDGIEKLVDNFSSSPGGGHFSEMGMKATKMQEEAMKILGTVNTVIKSIINIIYDLKEFELVISQYNAANSKNKEEANAGLLGLKQRWMDNVDIKRGRGSINMLAQDLQFVTIRDAFMMAKDLKELKDLDLNDRVKRILEARLSEFLKWRELSEKEIKKRYEIQKTYLKGQIDSLKIYTRWAKPYLRAAAQLEMKNLKNPALVTAFSTSIIQVTLLGKAKLKFDQEVIDKNMPQAFRSMKLKRDYYSCILVDFFFRGIPERLGQHYAFGGRAEVKFRAFSLNKEEIDMLNKKLSESDMNDALSLVEGLTTQSLEQLREDLEYFLKDAEEREKEEEKKRSSNDVNPFSALFGVGEKKEEKKNKKELKDIKSDSYMEKMARELAQKKANETCFSLFDVYKKAHGMASHPSPFG